MKLPKGKVECGTWGIKVCVVSDRGKGVEYDTEDWRIRKCVVSVWVKLM